mmetsp:Transcript_13449/g.60452  ORF Transcript_13449/g.60452 Transcript_13449/m.60452 type:complete len:271 (-) Transcript_13449:559-1371(-)
MTGISTRGVRLIANRVYGLLPFLPILPGAPLHVLLAVLLLVLVTRPPVAAAALRVLHGVLLVLLRGWVRAAETTRGGRPRRRQLCSHGPRRRQQIDLPFVFVFIPVHVHVRVRVPVPGCRLFVPPVPARVPPPLPRRLSRGPVLLLLLRRRQRLASRREKPGLRQGLVRHERWLDRLGSGAQVRRELAQHASLPVARPADAAGRRLLRRPAIRRLCHPPIRREPEPGPLMVVNPRVVMVVSGGGVRRGDRGRRDRVERRRRPAPIRRERG